MWHVAAVQHTQWSLAWHTGEAPWRNWYAQRYVRAERMTVPPRHHTHISATMRQHQEWGPSAVQRHRRIMYVSSQSCIFPVKLHQAQGCIPQSLLALWPACSAVPAVAYNQCFLVSGRNSTKLYHWQLHFVCAAVYVTVECRVATQLQGACQAACSPSLRPPCISYCA